MKLKELLLTLIPLLLIVSCDEDITGSNSPASVKKHQTIESLHYLSIGASDTKGWGATDSSFGYVALIRKELSEFVIDLDTTNVGVSGQTIDSINYYQKNAAVNAQPDLITIWTGGSFVVGSVEEVCNALFFILV